MNERKRTPIPDNAAGRIAFDLFRSFAEKILAYGSDMTSDFALAHFPGGKTVSRKYASMQFRRIIETPGGEYVTIIYDYMAQSTSTESPPAFPLLERGDAIDCLAK
jgi:hypothetical protein